MTWPRREFRALTCPVPPCKRKVKVPVMANEDGTYTLSPAAFDLHLMDDEARLADVVAVGSE